MRPNPFSDVSCYLLGHYSSDVPIGLNNFVEAPEHRRLFGYISPFISNVYINAGKKSSKWIVNYIRPLNRTLFSQLLCRSHIGIPLTRAPKRPRSVGN